MRTRNNTSLTRHTAVLVAARECKQCAWRPASQYHYCTESN